MGFTSNEPTGSVISRLFIAVIDAAALVGLIVLCAYVFELLDLHLATIEATIIFVVGWLYMVGLKRTRIGTLGYLLFRARVVDLKGQPPGLIRLTLRLLVSIGLNPFLDVIGSTSDVNRQCLRDKLGGTYVVRRRALPAGQGELVYTNLFFMNLALVYREVRRPRGDSV